MRVDETDGVENGMEKTGVMMSRCRLSITGNSSFARSAVGEEEHYDITKVTLHRPRTGCCEDGCIAIQQIFRTLRGGVGAASYCDASQGGQGSKSKHEYWYTPVEAETRINTNHCISFHI